MGELLARVRGARSLGGSARWVLQCAIPAVRDPAVLFGAGLAGARSLWSPARDRWERSAFAGVGCCEELRAGALAGAFERARVELLGDGPAPRWVGGLAFDAGRGAPRDEAWQGFGEGAFVLPRWTLFCEAERSYLQLALRDEERSNPALEGECAQVLTAIARNEGGGEGEGAGEGAEAFVREELSLAQWSALVERALGQLREGALEKVVLARRMRLALTEGPPADLRTVTARLRTSQPGCTVFAIERAGGVFLGATPERLAAVRGGRVSVDALAGSAPRGAAGDDARACEALARDEKELREHALVVRAVRAALEALCEAGSVRAAPAPCVRSLASVHHLHTHLEGDLRAGRTALDALASLHPTPAVCGAPRDAAMAFLRANEPAERGWYAGPVGWLDASGDAGFCVAIRSAVVRGRDAWAYAGAGLVEGSVAAREYEETRAKQRAMLHALGAPS